MDHDGSYLIVGAGVAGLSLAMRLLDHGIQPLLVDSGSFPCNKVCGEFFSPECLPILKHWEMLPALSIEQVRYFVGNRTYFFSLPQPAASESRYSFDARMLKAIEQRGGIVRLKTAVTHLEEGKVVLDNGEEYFPKALFIGTGRRGIVKPKMFYRGIKAHIEGLGEEKTLEMHLFPGAYLGISPVEGGRANVACLVKKEQVQREESPEALIRKVMKGGLGDNVSQFPAEWLQVEAPSFGIVSCPLWKNAYFIGDAAARLPPSSGDGLAAAVISGFLAADYAVRGDWMGYRKKWKRELFRRLFWDKPVHAVMMRPHLAWPILEGLQRFPSLFRFFFQGTRSRF